MEEKHNQATPRRPAGTRPLDAALIPIPLPHYIDQLKNEEAYSKNGKNAITVFKSTHITITLMALMEGQSFYPGNDEGAAIMSLQLISGRLDFESADTSICLKSGELLTLHQQLSFKAVAVAECVCLLTLMKTPA